VAGERTGLWLHERIQRALERAARAQEDSQELIAQCERTHDAVHTTLDEVHRGQRRRDKASRDD